VAEPGPEAFVVDLLPAIRQAAAIARALEGRVPNKPKRGERSPVKAALTLADTAAQEALLVPLLDRFSEVRLDAEEQTESVKRFSGRRDALVVLDPIDGTLRSYLNAEGPYAVMAGLAIAQVFQAALVALPRERQVFHAIAGGGAFQLSGDHERKPARAVADGDVVFVSYDLPDPVASLLAERGYQTRCASGGAISVAPLLPGVVGGLRIPNPAPLSLRGRIGLLVSREAGAQLGGSAGPPSPNLADTVPDVAVAADAAVLDDLLAALAAGR
jgi:fructose-1,6-bisphosphatase/inositol monophosphatase family enzyme